MLKLILSYRFIAGIVLVMLTLSISCSSVKKSEGFGKALNRKSSPWAKQVNDEILKLGNFNWIIITDPAFSALNREGVTTLTVDASSPEVIQQVFSTFERNGHVDARIYVSKESRFLTETETPGIQKFKKMRDQAVNGRKIRALDHLALEILIIEAKKKYRVLIIKTNTLLPYSSVFLELEYGYWDGESETALRKRMKR